ncbi:Uncharacterised protein [Legionella quateirensis]|uniref:Uncharacterized protein n=3 Tax=Legionella quateirensis TaxID=45072 RepID=A0A378L090_9GAMM|nr:hypothetical protein [Legionella quateirensis]STY19261.1 Uncharacterised protein [Legionella quateirensis]
MQAQCHVQESPHCIRDDDYADNPRTMRHPERMKELQMQAQCHVQEIPHCIRDDDYADNPRTMRHPERSEGTPNAGTAPHAGEHSLQLG